MDVVIALVLLGVLLLALWYARSFRRRSLPLFFWPWLDSRRGDRAQQAYVIEEEIRRTSERREDRDIAP